MDTNKSPYDPTPETIRQVINDVIETTEQAIEPMYPINALGYPYHIDFGDGHDTWCHPWQFGQGTLFAVDDVDRIHWMHPDIRTALDTVTEPMLRAALERSTQLRPDSTPAETARKFFGWCQESLATLDERMLRSQPFYDAVLSLGRFPRPQSAMQGFAALCHEHSVEEILGLNIARCALKLDLTDYVGTPPNSGAERASLLSRLIDPELCPAPSATAARDALSRLHLGQDKKPAETDLACVAVATAHGILSENLTREEFSPAGSANLLRLQIEAGALDPAPEDGSCMRMQERIGEILSGNCNGIGPISAHQALPIMAAANARLAALGHPPISPESCREAMRRFESIPF